MRIGSGRWPNYFVDKGSLAYTVLTMPDRGKKLVGTVVHAAPYTFVPYHAGEQHKGRRTLGQAVDIIIRLYEGKRLSTIDTQLEDDLLTSQPLEDIDMVVDPEILKTLTPDEYDKATDYLYDLFDRLENEPVPAQPDVLEGFRKVLLALGCEGARVQMYAHVPVMLTLAIDHNSDSEVRKVLDYLTTILQDLRVSHMITEFRVQPDPNRAIVVDETIIT